MIVSTCPLLLCPTPPHAPFSSTTALRWHALVLIHLRYSLTFQLDHITQNAANPNSHLSLKPSMPHGNTAGIKERSFIQPIDKRNRLLAFRKESHLQCSSLPISNWDCSPWESLYLDMEIDMDKDSIICRGNSGRRLVGNTKPLCLDTGNSHGTRCNRATPRRRQVSLQINDVAWLLYNLIGLALRLIGDSPNTTCPSTCMQYCDTVLHKG